MANTTSSHTKGDKGKSKRKEIIHKDKGMDSIENSHDEYNMEQYGEFIPTFNSWILMDEQRKRIHEIIDDNESLWKTKK